MRYRRNCILFISIVMLMLSVTAGICHASPENLIINSGFEELDRNGLPVGWFTDAYVQDVGYSLFSVIEDDESPEGSHYACIQNLAMNDARFAQKIEVEPETLYKVTAMVRADTDNSGRGANISIEGLYVFSESIYHTEGDWKSLTWYGETGENQHDVTLFVRLGGYSGESIGTASFDALSLTEVNEVPGDLIADRWFKQDTAVYNDYDEDEDQSNEKTPFWPILLLLSAGWLLISASLLRWTSEKEKLSVRHVNERKSTAYWLIPGLAAALILRLILSYIVKGYEVDVNCFLSWGNTMLRVGPSQFYQSTSFCDYPPAYAYILGINAWIVSLISGTSFQDSISPIIFRMIPVISDIIACVLLFRTAKRYGCQERTSGIFTLIMAFNPVIIINSACWGQMDSVLCLILMLVATTAISHQWMICLPCYMLAVLIKPQALMLGFLGLLALVLEWFTRKENRKQILYGLEISVVVFLVIVLPYSSDQEPFWVVNQYAKSLSEYPYATVNTANYWYLFNGNWSSIENTAPVLPSILIGVVLAIWGIYLWNHGNGNHFRWIDPITAWLFSAAFLIMSFIKVSWTVLGILTMAYSFITMLPMYIRGRKLTYLPLIGGVLFLLLYTFGIKMHERYLFPAFFLLALSFITTKDRRVLPILLACSITVFMNIGIVLDNSIRLGASYGHLNADTEVLARIISLMNIFVSLFGCYVSYDICVRRHIVTESVTKYIRILPLRFIENMKNPDSYHPDNRLYWNRLDTILVGMITFIYAFVSLMTLGSTKAPQTFWCSSTYDESVTFDLGKKYEDFTILYFAQVSRYNFSVSVSEDGSVFNDEKWAEMDQGQCWKWKYVTPSYENTDGTVQFSNAGSYQNVMHFSGRYVRLTAHQIGLKLNEVIFRNSDGKTIPAIISDRSGENIDSPNYTAPECLLDEQDTLEGIPNYFGWNKNDSEVLPPDTAQPSWFNSTYFDEIYHARTAFEHLNGTVPYETSHPPLGKLLMSVGIAIFGMTPFGWRFMGALAGILMLPGMYLLTKQLTKKTLPAILSCAMMALDCMHLTQTQIATIDSFPVLFIILSWFFMLRFLQTDLIHTPMKKILSSLGPCGFMMGLGIASKWIGIYSGLGLAVAFFWHCIRYFLICKKTDSENGFMHRFLSICSWCLLFFIAVPTMIYLISYIPYFSWKTQIQNPIDFIREVISAQIGMFNYHSTPGLGMDHPFYSPWYEWPIIKKPMYYASPEFLPDRKYAYAIFSFGNPAVWFVGLGSILICIFLWIRNKRFATDVNNLKWHIMNPDFDNEISFILIGLLAQFLPWVLVPRGTYIYHYFASIPFLILASGYLFSKLLRKKPGTARIVAWIYISVMACMFLLFWPYASGMVVPVHWLNLGKSLLRIYY